MGAKFLVENSLTEHAKKVHIVVQSYCDIIRYSFGSKFRKARKLYSDRLASRRAQKRVNQRQEQ